MDNVDLSDLFTTRTEANDFLMRLTTISEMFFQTGFNFDHALTQHFGINKRDRFISILNANNINTESLPAVKEFIFILMSKISSLPVLTLAIAFEPQEQTLKTLAEWFFINMHKQILFDISVDKSVIAGAKITYNGKFFDFSIRPTFERVLQNYITRLSASASTQTKTALQQPAQQQVQQSTQQPVQQPIPQPTQDVTPEVKKDLSTVNFGKQ